MDKLQGTQLGKDKCICRALFQNHMEGTEFDKHFKGYQPQPVVESDVSDFVEADMEAADLEAEEMLAADIEAKEMLAAGSEADDSVPPYPS